MAQPDLPADMAVYPSVHNGQLNGVDLRAEADPRAGLCWICSDPLADSAADPVPVPGLINALAHPECVQDHHPNGEDTEC